MTTRVCKRCLLEESEPRVGWCPHVHSGCLRIQLKREKSKCAITTKGQTMTIATTNVTRVGFSGSREGLSEAQHTKLRDWLLLFCMNPGPVWLHHGDCIGADTEAHHFAKELGYKIKLHPPLDPKYRSHLDKDCDIVDQCWSYHGRNQRILKDCQLLLATPKSSTNLGGGTWYTIEKAIAWKIPHVIIFADGNIIKEGIL